MMERTVVPFNHVLHLLVTVLLCGLWVPVWIIMALSHREYGNWRCMECGGTDWGGQ